ncbi:MAG: thiazole synthase [Lentisphaerae bacterium RIFOXYC12_FULL_60_16]|nr:MAG: thiazole synthase [Lentisphaerae bacterium RIFOXYC12_FULL_60_16]OGV68625.1 MAG: thiazole synthase [Lentisphaerae bacterium RIFOXYA12_FULL_60_10]OGV85678.1 MAG: thiazole synthase [Lentisphaerae bacterium RIFOXYB12_FULL_60_10]
MIANDTFTIGGHVLESRLLLGTGKFADRDTMARAIEASGTRLVTVALRRFNPNDGSGDLLGPLSRIPGLRIMPNTSGARTADEAIRIAQIARELTDSPFIKLEIHPNPLHLMPDPIETFEAARVLARDGFLVLPYMPADPVLAKRLEDVGCAAVMPLGSAIGSGQGLRTSELIRLIVESSRIPVIVDAGLRSPSEAAAALEMGCDAVLVNSAIAAAEQPVEMARAFAEAVRAGRRARLAGLMPVGASASPTSPLTSFLAAPEPG